MKSQFLKIAGVKSEKAFYKKYPTEAAFFKAHPEAKKLANGGEQDKGQLKKLDDLTNFTNYNDLPEAAFGDFLSKGSDFMNKMDKFAGGLDKVAGKAAPFVGAATDIIGGIGALKQEKKALKQAKQDAKLTGVLAQAAETRPEEARRQYVRPEDVLVQPNTLFPTYGTGTNILAAEDGATIGGNPTEIMNTFAPNTIYSDMGYEPLNDSSKIKQYYKGGKLTKAQTGAELFQKAGGTDFINNIATRIGTGGGPTGSSKLGKGIGSAAGMAFLGPVGGIVGGALGSLVGGLFGKKKQKEMAAYKKEASGNIDRITGQNVAQGIQNEYSSYMEDGGIAQTGTSKGKKNLQLKGYSLPSDSSYYNNPYTQNQPTAIYEFNDPKRTQFFEHPYNAYQEAYNRSYMDFMGQSLASGRRIDYPSLTGNIYPGNIRTDARERGEIAARKAYMKDIQDMSLYDPESLFKAAMKGQVSPQDTIGMTRFDRSVIEEGAKKSKKGKLEEGGWVSHNWQPQVITKFGEYDVDQLLAPDPTMNTLRTGGHIRQNNIFPTDQFAMGGDLKVYRGEAEPMSVNPFLPDGGETIMFRGPSHENGGMPIEYGDSPVEVEGGEPAVKLRNGSSGDEDLVVFGNLIEPKSKRKFKNVVADISKKEARQNKLIDKSVNQLDNLDVDTPFDQLKMSALKANLMGGTMKLKNYADEKMDLAAMQSAINETAELNGLEADALAKGKVKKAKKGINVPKAQGGLRTAPLLILPGPSLNIPSAPTTFSELSSAARFGAIDENAQDIAAYRMNQRGANYVPGQAIQQSFADWLQEREVSPFSPKNASDESGKGLGTLMDIANQIIPQLRPSNAQELDIRQILPELSVAGEKPDAVYAQKFQPNLIMQYDVADPQAQLNAITAQATAASKAVGNDPAAQAFIMGQAAELKNQVIGQAQQANRANYLATANRNIEKLDQAQLENLRILDQQQVRQAQAKSATKATKLAAQQSIASKYLQNKAEQQQLQAYENLYNYRFGDQGRAQNFNPLAQFNLPQVAKLTSEELEALAKLKSAQEKRTTKTSRNGSIVKALKNL